MKMWKLSFQVLHIDEQLEAAIPAASNTCIQLSATGRICGKTRSHSYVLPDMLESVYRRLLECRPL